MWKSVARKKLRQSGQVYTDKHNREHATQYFVYKKCFKCAFKCSDKITENIAKIYYTEFWSLSDDEKFNFYEKTITRALKKTSTQTSTQGKPDLTKSKNSVFYLNLQ